jgi:hypothetical protein
MKRRRCSPPPPGPWPTPAIWLTPRVNGLPRYDKPPLVVLADGPGLRPAGPGPAGIPWAPGPASLPSALSSVGLMLLLAATLLRWPQHRRWSPGAAGAAAVTAVSAALAFALSPLVLLWSRIAVSDALFSACSGVGAAAVLAAATPVAGGRWWPGWLVLGSGGAGQGAGGGGAGGPEPCWLFAWLQREVACPAAARLRPLPGSADHRGRWPCPGTAWSCWRRASPSGTAFSATTTCSASPAVVNNHLPALVVLRAGAGGRQSLPFTPLLLLGSGAHLRWPAAGPAAGPAVAAAASPPAGCWRCWLFFTRPPPSCRATGFRPPQRPGLLIALAARRARLAAGPRPRRSAAGPRLATAGTLAPGRPPALAASHPAGFR